MITKHFIATMTMLIYLQSVLSGGKKAALILDWYRYVYLIFQYSEIVSVFWLEIIFLSRDWNQYFCVMQNPKIYFNIFICKPHTHKHKMLPTETPMIFSQKWNWNIYISAPTIWVVTFFTLNTTSQLLGLQSEPFMRHTSTKISTLSD